MERTEQIKYNSDGMAEMTPEIVAMLGSIRAEAANACAELVDVAQLKAGDVLAVGCSTSEVCGHTIGKASVLPVAEALFEGIYSVLRERGIFIAAQCCEHLNRAIITERACAEKYGLEEVCVRPYPKAGGSFATVAFDSLAEPVALEGIKAQAGIDIGGTLIGMQLREVAVPVRLSVQKIGNASILCARTRPKYIGGPRAKYE